MLKKVFATTAAALAVAGIAAGAATAQTKLRIQTHFSPETLSGKMAAEFIEDITAMSNGEIQVEMFYASCRGQVGRDLRCRGDRYPRLRHDGRVVPDRQETRPSSLPAI